MQTIARSNFTTVKTEGAILPADLLQRVAGGDVEGLKPEDYFLAPNERLNEAINRSWNRLQGVWEAFDAQRRELDATDTGTSLTRERWLLILFQELGFGRLPFQRSVELEDGSTYPISHAWEHVPIHLVTFRQELDRRDPAAKRSPHSLLQEFLNRSENHLWGIVSNGLALRILRDNVSLTRAAYLEFDLEAMMEGEVYADFSLLWLIGHQSRLEPGADAEAPHTPANCWLELWSQEAVEQGTRALDSLRDGVQEAIAALGSGFLAHRANIELREQLTSGALSNQDYYRQLLRLVYRLIFLFVAEDRDLLLQKDAAPAARARYSDYYSVGRLRRLAEVRRGGPHPDLYRTLRQVFALLREGYEPLGLPGLGSFLFSDRAAPVLDGAEIANSDLLAVVRALAFTIEGRVLRPVDYKNLGAEELGSVYESLLELHPQLNVRAATFNLDTAAGSERKTTGSYYTPTSLITSLLDSALEPVVVDRLRGKSGAAAEEALLAIKVVDPAAGSGHFLIAAANRLATHLARVRTGDDEPSPADRRDALRDVVGRCIYGVDINEMAVELCKVALWMETLDPGRPLSFLDQHIQCGNSLIGATPALLRRGIPDEAFTAITGDDRTYVSEWKKINKKEREGQLGLRLDAPWERLGDLANAVAGLQGAPDETLDGVRAREEAYAELVRSSAYEYTHLWADAWCAAFVFPKHYGIDYPITENDFRDIERNPHSVPRWMREEIAQLSKQYQFFHWHLAFPEVFVPGELALPDEEDVTGWSGGFDVVLGNPPWERIKLQEKEWFASRSLEIAGAPNAAARGRLIKALQQEDPALHQEFLDDRRKAEGESHLVRNSGQYPLCGRGDVNTYAIFSELGRHIVSEDGRAGIIVQSDIATGDTYKFFFSDLMNQGKLVSFYDFVNTEGLFPSVHRTHPHFCLVTMSGVSRSTPTDFAFWNTNASHLKEDERHFTLTAEEIALLNPNTRTCPIFRSKRDAELTKAIYRRVPVLIEEGPPEINPWGIKFSTMFHMSNDSGLFRTREQLEEAGYVLQGNRFVRPVNEQSQDGKDKPGAKDDLHLPLYEAKMLHHFDHRWATYENGETRDVTALERNDPGFVVRPRYWVADQEVETKRADYDFDWYLAFRDITNTTNERTAIFTQIPISGVSNKAPLLIPESRQILAAIGIGGATSSFVFDFVTRRKMGGTSLNFYIAKQLPILRPAALQEICSWSQVPAVTSVYSWLLPYHLELVYTAYDLRAFAQDCGYHGPPFPWDEARRFLLRCELDAAFFHLYGIARDDVAYIMDTFPIVRRHDEAAHGEFRTKRVILEIYDELADAIRTGQPYQTRLDPPPGDPRAAHPWDEKYLGLELPPDQWWQEIEPAAGRGDTDGQLAADPVATSHPAVSPAQTDPPATPRTIKEPGPTLELKSPARARSKEKPPPALPDQPPLLSDFTPPRGSRAQRLKRVMALGQPKNGAELAELAAALGDEDGNIRWLAGSSLVRLRGPAVVATLAAYLETGLGEPAQAEAIKVLGLIADTAEEEAVREAAHAIVENSSDEENE